MSHTVVTGDAVTWARDYSGPLFHALLCDTPYHLESIVKRFGKPGSAPARHAADGAFSRLSAGFIGESWDDGAVSFRASTWAAFARVLYPGAIGAVIMGARGWHRLAAAIEGAAGVSVSELSGWSDALAAARAARSWELVERVESEMRERSGLADGLAAAGLIVLPSLFGWLYGTGQVKATPVRGEAARSFAGHRYGAALKPALEPVVLFQVPHAGRPLDGITATGAGTFAVGPAGAAAGLSRYPSNFVAGCSPECATGGAHVAGCPIAGLEAQRAGAPEWFAQVAAALAEAEPVRYAPKPSAKESNAGLAGSRNGHPTRKPIALAEYLARLLLPPAEFSPRRLFVPFAGSGSEMIGGLAAGWEHVTGVELGEVYANTARARLAHAQDKATIRLC